MRRRGGRPSAAAWLAGLCLAGLSPAGEAAAIGSDQPITELIQAGWRQQDGLAQDTVYAILQSRDGFLWCGTRAGLSRFDGVRFETFGREELQLEQGMRIQALAEDAAGDLWIGTGSGELLRYRAGAFRRFGAADGLKGEGRAVGRIAGLATRQAGELFVGTYSEGIFRLAGERFERIPETAAISAITRLALDSHGDLWIATIGDGVYRYRSGAPLLHLTRREGLPNDYVGSVAPAHDGGVLFATHSGIGRWRDGRMEVWGAEQGLTFDHVTALREDPAGSIWFASYGGGLQRLRPDGGIERLPAGLPGREAVAWDIYVDRSGMVWTGTVDHGLRLLADGSFSTWRAEEPAGLPSRLITTLAEDEAGTLWIGTRDAGLAWRRNCQTTGSSGRIGRPEGLTAEAVWALDTTGGEVLAGTNRGLFRIANGRAANVPLPGFASPPEVRALERHGELRFVGTDRGLLLLSQSGAARPLGARPRLLTKAHGLPADEVLDLELDAAGRLYIATTGGLAVLQGESLSRLREYDRLAAGQPLALHSDPSGALWVIASSGGLVRLAAGEAAALGPHDGLLDDNLYAILEDRQGLFWLGTSSGILRVARTDLEAHLRDPAAPLPQTLFDRFDGVYPGGIAAFGKRAVQGRGGILYLATFGGVAVHTPEANRKDDDPRALIERIEIDGRPAGGAFSGGIPGSHRHLTFALAAPLPHAGRGIRLRYRLSGVDADWVEAGPERRATYSGLVPGAYLFEAQASTTAGLYLTEPVAYAFRVDAGFFQSWKLPATLLLALSAAVWLFHRWRSGQILVRQRELDARIAEATADIRVLHGLLPLCASCHKVRDDQGYWQQIETYIAESSDLEFTHGFCPDCARMMIAQIDEESSRTN